MLKTMVAGLCIALAAAVSLRAEIDKLPKTLLFVDDADVLYRSGTIKEVQPLQKYEGNPVIIPEKPWEGMIGWVSNYRDPKTGKFQMWYQAYNDKMKDMSLKCVVAYAESDDGIHWVKPNLGLYSYGDVKDTNIVLIGDKDAYSDRYCNSVLVDPKETDPAKKYKMIYYDWDVGEEAKLGSGTRVAFSPDGIHWTPHGKMVSKTSYGGKGMQPPFEGEGPYHEQVGKNGAKRLSWRVPLSMSDAQDVIYDPKTDTYLSYGKMWIQGPDGGHAWKHAMGRITSKDFINWSKPELLLTPNDNDPPNLEFHTTPAFIYNDQFFSPNQLLDRKQGTFEIELISSRDGVKWDRSLPNNRFLLRGEGPVFDASTLLTNSNPELVGDEMYFYYGGYRGTAIGGVGLDQQVMGSKDYHSGVGLATMKKDRFVAIAPDPRIPLVNSRKVTRDTVGVEPPKPKTNTLGQVTLRPLDLSKVKEMTVNADASKGSLWIEILNEDGYRVRGFSKDEAVPIKEDGLEQKVAWTGKTFSDLKPGKYLVRIHLDNARFYACTFR